MCWTLWKERNTFYFDHVDCLPNDIISRAERSWKEFHRVHPLPGATQGMGMSSPESPPRWSPRLTSCVKLNVDVEAIEDPYAHGLGFILRDSVGVQLRAVSQKVSFPSVAVGEVMAIREGLREAITLGFTNILVEFDSLEVVNLINGVHSVGEIFVASIVEDLLEKTS
ncbi:hypothetical protein NE237_013718 [Protea cynaroides]|uniref:RNase H type-1 domain-containing protein n=1 Tax=Protea cynaroides TaxID=273540 RepID=A0A9Q0H2L7_9MAGN|nr:hypothetical protein NE237_013718 [Protea cynaroides]